MVAFLLWCLLLSVCWPLALLVAICAPFYWVFRFGLATTLAVAEGAVRAVWAIICWPFRVLARL
jgi:hypothetical protein